MAIRAEYRRHSTQTLLNIGVLRENSSWRSNPVEDRLGIRAHGPISNVSTYLKTIEPSDAQTAAKLKAAFLAGAESVFTLKILRDKARKSKKLGVCESCGERKAEHRHHVDRDITNADPKNLLALCKPCHHEFHKTWKRRYAPKNCVVCGRESTCVVRGRCQRCAGYFKRHGSERPNVDYLKPGREAGKFCRRGHEFTPENTYVRACTGKEKRSDEGKVCKECHRIRCAKNLDKPGRREKALATTRAWKQRQKNADKAII